MDTTYFENISVKDTIFFNIIECPSHIDQHKTELSFVGCNEFVLETQLPESSGKIQVRSRIFSCII